MRRVLLLPAVALIGLSALVGCGAAKSTSSGGPTSSAASTGSTVTIKDFSFKPAVLHVKVGTKVVFMNTDSATHTATDSGTFDSKDLKQGASYAFTFNSPGDYHFICSIHQYMKGEIVVSK